MQTQYWQRFRSFYHYIRYSLLCQNLAQTFPFSQLSVSVFHYFPSVTNNLSTCIHQPPASLPLASTFPIQSSPATSPPPISVLTIMTTQADPRWSNLTKPSMTYYVFFRPLLFPSLNHPLPLSHVSSVTSQCYIVRQLDLFQFPEDVSPLIWQASSVLTNWEGVADFKPCVCVSSQGHWGQVWTPRRMLVQHGRWVISCVIGHCLCLKIFLLLF